MNIVRPFLVCLVLSCFGICSAAEPALEAFRGQNGQIKIVGGTAPIPLMRAAARRIMTYNPSVRVSVDGGGSGAGIKMVSEGEAEISCSGRPLKPDELEQYGLVSSPFAIDGVAVAVNRRNPVSGLSKEQLKDIYSGKIKNWDEVGGHSAPISIYARGSGSGARATFEDMALDGEPCSVGKALDSNNAVKAAIAHDIYAIGFLAIGNVDNAIKTIRIDGKAPTQEALASLDYPITRYLYMNTKGEPAGLVADFVRYIYSPAGADLIRMAGYIPYNPKQK